MLHTALRAAWSRKRRLIGTALSIVLGVAFLCATLVVGDSARAGFDTAFTEANAGVDAVVRSGLRLDGGESASTGPIAASLVGVAARVDGVDQVVPAAEGAAQIIGTDGEPLGGEGPPSIGAAWIDDPKIGAYELAEGRAPVGPGEVVIDRSSATDGDLAVGDRTIVLAPGPLDVEVVGIARFGAEDSLGGVTLAAFELSEAQRLFAGGTDALTSILVTAREGVSEEELVARLEAALPGSAEAISAADLTAEQKADIEGDFLGFFQTALLVFAFVSLLVAAFSIFNTFSILAAQRTRESALLRTLGASRRQVLVAGLGEAAIVGALGSALGVLAGLGLAAGLLALLDSSGFGLPIDGLQVETASMVIAAGVGFVVTLLGGIVPALKAASVAPLAALRDVAIDSSGASRWRLVTGGLLVATGAALVLTGASAIARAGIGAVAVVIGIVLIGPVVARPIGNVLGAPLRLRGLPGDLARRNAVRNPRRTSGTAASLLVGVGVVSLFTVFGASVSKSIEDAVDRSFGGDLVIESSGWSGAGLGTGLQADVRALPEVEAAAGLGFGSVALDGDDREVGFADFDQLAAVAEFDTIEGDMALVGAGDLAVSGHEADERGWALGDEVEATFIDGAVEPLEIAAIYDDRAMGGDVLIPTETWAPHTTQLGYEVMLVGLSDGTSIAEGRAAIEAVAEPHGGPDVRDRQQFVASEASEIDTLLTVIYALLAIAILIALMGIANTLSLSIHERTRELGLLRAIGQSRSQVRAMVRWESVLVATFGALGGVGVGVFLGWGLVRAINEAEGLGAFALPAGSLVTIVVLGAAAGVLAGLRPAWRASKLDVLQAVSAD